MRTLQIFALFLGLAAIVIDAKPYGATKPKPHELTNRMLHSTSEHHSRGEREAAEESSSTATKPTDHSKIEQQSKSQELQVHHVTEHNVKKIQEQKDEIPMEKEHIIHITPKPVKPQKLQKSRKNGNGKNPSKSHTRKANAGTAKAHHKTSSIGFNGKKKLHHKTNSSTTNTRSHHKHQQTGIKTTNIKVKPSTAYEPASSKSKSHKPLKKYNAKKHGWKKTLRKEKAIEKQKEKRERREKKQKNMMHHSIEKKN